MSKLLKINNNTNQNSILYNQTQTKEKNINPINTFDFIMKCPSCTEACSSFLHKSGYILEYNCKNNHRNICTLLQLNENKKAKTCVNNIKYDAYCLDCNEDICTHCENKHKDHKKEFYFENSKILKKQLSELKKRKKEFDALIKELKEELGAKLDIIQKSFEIYLDIKNNFEFLTKEKLDNQINFNMNFNKDFENIINVSKEKNIIKTFEAIFQLSDKISYKDSIYKKSNNFLEIKVENIHIKNYIKTKEYIIQQQRQFEIKANKIQETYESNGTNNHLIIFRKENQRNLYQKFVEQYISCITDSQSNKKFFKNSQIIYTMFYYNIPYIQEPKNNNLFQSSQNITIQNSKKLKNDYTKISSQLSENNENKELKSENSEINEKYVTPEEIEYIVFSFYQDKSAIEDTLYYCGESDSDSDDTYKDNCNELELKKRAEEDILDTYNYNQDIIMIYLKEETYPIDKCRAYSLYIIYCNNYLILIFKLKNINVAIFSNFKVISFLFLIIKFILLFDTWNNYYDLITRNNNLIEDIISLVSLLSSKNRNLIEYYELFNYLISSLSNSQKIYDNKEKRYETEKLFQQITYDKRRDLLNFYEYIENPLSNFIPYQTNIKISINECQEIINSIPKQTESEANASNSNASKDSKDSNIENISHCSLNENNEIEHYFEIQNEFEENERNSELYNDYDEYWSFDSSINNSEELKIEEKNESEHRDLNIEGNITTINKKSNSVSFTNSIILEDIYNYNNNNYYNDLSINIIKFVEITNNIVKIKNNNNNLVKQKQKSSCNKILFILLSNAFYLYPISKNINLISDSFNQIKNNQNKEDISLSVKNTNESNKNLSMNSNIINKNNNLAKRKNKSPEFINTIIRLYITNHNSRFFNFDYSGIKYQMHLITAHHREKIVYILFLFDNVLLFYFKKDKDIRKLIFPYGYLCKNILYGYKHKKGKNFCRSK